MTFLIPWALLALALLVPLSLAHLRRPPRREVASTLLWRELGVTALPKARRIARPARPVLLLLQAAAVILAVAALAEPASPAGNRPARQPPAVTLAGEHASAASAAAPAGVTEPAAPLPRQVSVAVVGDGGAVAELARGFGAVPGVAVRAVSPSRYAPSRLTGAALTVFVHWLPPGGLTGSPARLFLVDPPSRAGRVASGTLGDPVLSGLDDTSPLLAGVDLTSLSVPPAATERVTGPGWLAPVAWTPSGPLLAAGTSGGQRVAVLGFDPAGSNLPRLPAFPILLRNVLRWAVGGGPGTQAGPTAHGRRAPVARRAPAGVSAHAAHQVSQPDKRSQADQGGQGGTAWPWWRWAVLGALAAFAAEAGYVLPVSGRRRGAFWPATVRVAAIGLLGAALSGVTAGLPGGGAPVVLIDRSGSVTGAVSRAEDAWTAAIRRVAPRVQVVDFGTRTGTDIARAVGAAQRLVPSVAGASRVLLLSDGLATAGGTAGDAVNAAAAVRRPVDVADVAAGVAAPDAAVTRLAVPRAVRAGDAITVQATVRATVPRPATVTLRRDGRVAARLAVRLAAGDNPLLVSSPSGTPGWRRFRITVTMAGDRVPANDTLDAVTEVAGPPRLLYAGSGGSADRAVPELLRRLGFTVSAPPLAALPRQAPGYHGFAGVVLDDIPNGALVPAQLTALATAVRTRGLGLLVLGGPRSLTAGWYPGTPLTAALPVAGTGSGPGGATLELVLDRSGSMNDLAGADTKISMAQAAAVGAIAFTRAHHDRLGIVSFDTVPHVLVPVRTMTTAAAAAADRAVTGLTASGGTDIYAALRAAAGQLGVTPGASPAAGAAGSSGAGPAEASPKQLILMTDGVSQSAFYDTLARRLRGGGVSVSAIGLGGQVDQALLRHLAGLGGGRYYYTNDAAALPRIFAADERRSERPDRVTGPIPAEVTASVPAVRSLIGTRRPDVWALDTTALKPLATGAITTGAVTTGAVAVQGSGAQRYPLLAQWQYGLGRVAVWTPGLSPAWAGGWTGEDGLWSDTVRWLLPGVATPALEPRLLDAHPGGAATVLVDTAANAGAVIKAAALRAVVTPPHGAPVRVPLGAVPGAAGVFAGQLPGAGPGVYRVTVAPPAGGSRAVRSAAAELAVGYPREYLPTPAGPALLAQLAAVSGGRVLSDPVSGARWESARNGTHRLGLWWLLAALALAAFCGGVALRPPPPGRRTRRQRASHADELSGIRQQEPMSTGGRS